MDLLSAGVLEDVQKFYSINNAQAGLLQTSFIMSYMLLSPIFGYLGDRYNRVYIMAAGVLFWSLITLAGSFVPGEVKMDSVSIPCCFDIQWLVLNVNASLYNSCTVRFGQRSFRSSALSVWNDLPSELKNSDITGQGFKSRLKSWLFKRAYRICSRCLGELLFKRRYINPRFD